MRLTFIYHPPLLITKVVGSSPTAKCVETAGIPILERDFSDESVVSAMIAQQLAMQDGAGRVNRCAAGSHDGNRPCGTLVAEAPDLGAEAPGSLRSLGRGHGRHGHGGRRQRRARVRSRSCATAKGGNEEVALRLA